MMNKLLGSIALLCFLAGSLRAQPGVSYALKAYPTASEAMQHLLPQPPACVDYDGGSICDPTFSLEVGPDGAVLWRPTIWVVKGSKGTCSDDTGHAWSPCTGPSPGSYRIQPPTPPAPATSSAQQPAFYNTAEEAAAHLSPAPAQCSGEAGAPICVPTFSLAMNRAGQVFWRPAGWQRANPPGACVDPTGHEWSSCGVPPPGVYRYHIPPLPLPALRPPPLLIPPIRIPQPSPPSP